MCRLWCIPTAGQLAALLSRAGPVPSSLSVNFSAAEAKEPPCLSVVVCGFFFSQSALHLSPPNTSRLNEAVRYTQPTRPVEGWIGRTKDGQPARSAALFQSQALTAPPRLLSAGTNSAGTPSPSNPRLSVLSFCEDYNSDCCDCLRFCDSHCVHTFW